LHGELHRDGAPAIERANGDKFWLHHGALHRDGAPAIELADGSKEWHLHDKEYKDAAAWATSLLKLRNEPHDDAAVQKFLRTILMKDDLI
jgi:hypothetical protein